MIGDTEEKPYTDQMIGFPPPDAICSDGGLFRGDVQVGSRNMERARRERISGAFIRKFDIGEYINRANARK